MTNRAEAVINLSAIKSNVATLKAKAGVDLMAVVKADAYGHGLVPVAKAALDGGATWLGVTRNPDRARALRQCLDLKSSVYAPRRCAYGLGETVLDESGWDADMAVKICAEGPSHLAVHCQESALRLLQVLAKEAGRDDVCAPASVATRKLCVKAKASPYRYRTALDTPLEAWL